MSNCQNKEQWCDVWFWVNSFLLGCFLFIVSRISWTAALNSLSSSSSSCQTCWWEHNTGPTAGNQKQKGHCRPVALMWDIVSLNQTGKLGVCESNFVLHGALEATITTMHQIRFVDCHSASVLASPLECRDNEALILLCPASVCLTSHDSAAKTIVTILWTWNPKGNAAEHSLRRNTGQYGMRGLQGTRMECQRKEHTLFQLTNNCESKILVGKIWAQFSAQTFRFGKITQCSYNAPFCARF